MNVVVLTGWQPGLKKISLTRLIRAYAGYDLTEGKQCVDELLAGRVVVLPEPGGEQASLFVAEARKLGAFCARIPRETLAA